MSGPQAVGVEASTPALWQEGTGTHATTMDDLVRVHCETGKRHSLRVIGAEARGNVFFDRGRIVHAEFGEDIGLRALVEMRCAGELQTKACTRRWPSHPSLNLEPATFLSSNTGNLRAEGVVNKTAVVRRTPPADSTLVAVNDSVQDDTPFIEPPPLPECPADGSAAEPTRPEALEPPLPPSHDSGSSLDSDGPTIVPEAMATTETVPQQPVDTDSSGPASSGPASSGPASSGPAQSSPSLPRFAVRRPSVLPSSVRRQQKRRERSGNEPVAAVSTDTSTTMVRLSPKGRLLAARGDKSEELADAAAYIYDMVRLIASDLNRRGHASIHMRGQGRSLIVARSEVKDVAAALGPTAKLTSLLTKSGLR